MRMFRQGDVLIRQIEHPSENRVLRAALKDAKKFKPVEPDRGKTVLAYGETTGHAHALDAMHARMFEGIQEPNKCYLLIDTDIELQHFNINTGDMSDSDHGPIALGPGTYEVIRQREYQAPDVFSRVED